MNSPTDIAKSVWRKVTDVADRYERRRFPIQYDASHSPDPTVYFLTPDYRLPSGGVRVIYRHVDLLNGAGIRARVLHRRPGFRCTWFANDTAVTNTAASTIRLGDVLVVPELEVIELASVPPGVRRVIFNQNSHLTWQRSSNIRRFYTRPNDLAAVICVSEHNRQMLLRAFPEAPLRRVTLGIDPAVFHPRSSKRRKRIAYMPRRGLDDARQVMAMLHDSMPDGWDFCPLNNLSHEEVAQELRNSQIFLAVTHAEGFGLPPAEAMACGCYVIGNDGFAGREFFRAEFSTRVESGDIVGFVDALEAAFENVAMDDRWCSRLGELAADYIHAHYSLEREQESVVTVYAEVLGGSFELAAAIV